MKKTLLAFVLASGLASVASAGQVAISDIGGGIMLNSGPMGPGVFGNNQTTWTHASLGTAHALLNGSGIDTNGKITILAADTTHGLSLMALFDQDSGGQLPISMGNVDMVTAAHGNNLAYLNAGAGNVVITPNGPGQRTAIGTVAWNSNGGGNGFAWANLENGNSITFRFNKVLGMALGLVDPGTFQFVNWNGTSWQVVALPESVRSFTQSNDFGFSATVQVQSIPLPAGAAMAGASLLGLCSIRRRRTR